MAQYESPPVAAAARSADVGPIRNGSELREAERAILYWRQKVAQFGGSPPLMSLELTRMLTRDWNHRFLISSDPSTEDYVFLIYGGKIARLLDLPDQPSPQVPMIKQLPQRYVEIFVEGCREAAAGSRPARRSGGFERWDGQAELYRAVFLPVGVRPNSFTSLIYGAFNRRVLRKPPAPLGAG